MSDLRFKLCPRCKRLKPVGNGDSLCSECAEEKKVSRKRDRDYKSEYEGRKSTEDPGYRRFYRSKEWQMTSRHYAHTVGYRCEECGSWGTDVHHVIPIQEPEGWERRFDETNLKMLCVSCHNKAHGRTFSNDWGGGHAGRKTEEAHRDEQAAHIGSGENGTPGHGGCHKVSDYR